jgi:hypothetical protein
MKAKPCIKNIVTVVIIIIIIVIIIIPLISIKFLFICVLTQRPNCQLQVPIDTISKRNSVLTNPLTQQATGQLPKQQ